MKKTLFQLIFFVFILSCSDSSWIKVERVLEKNKSVNYYAVSIIETKEVAITVDTNSNFNQESLKNILKNLENVDDFSQIIITDMKGNLIIRTNLKKSNISNYLKHRHQH